MVKHLRYRAVIMLSSFLCIMTLFSCSNTATNIKTLDDRFSRCDYAGTYELASRYLQQDIQSGYLLYKGVSAWYLGAIDEAARALELYLAIAPVEDTGRTLALRTVLEAAARTGNHRQVIAAANELEALGEGSLESRKDLYASLLAVEETDTADQVLETLLAPVLPPDQFGKLTVEAHAPTHLVASSLSSWLAELKSGEEQTLIGLYDTAVEYIRLRDDADQMLALAQAIYADERLSTDSDRSVSALRLGDIYAASGQKVLARRYWTEAAKNGQVAAAKRLATHM
ncbi:MAG: hypothetical protein ACOX6K_04085 [Sphaerochaetaceae bacterium]|jgi:tetratricopeptide (TPR) repeat protein